MTSPLTFNPEIGWLHSGAEELDRQLRDGDGMGWPGDPRLSLSVGVLEHRLTRAVGRRYEVWRHNEDGTDTIIAHWRLEDFDRILFDLAKMRLDAPGHVDTQDEIDKHNAAIEADIDAKAKDSLGEMMEHAAKLHHDTNNPRNVFRQMPGLRDEPKTEAKEASDS